MPTGYTAAIADGIDFKTFVLRCARAMGACITIRDDPNDKEIPEKFEPTTYHIKEIEKAEQRLAELANMNATQAETKARKAYEKEVNYHEEGIRKDIELRQKYTDMLLQVKAWQPPSSDHEHFQEFMVGQIKSSIEHDCGVKYHQDGLRQLKRLSGDEWLLKEKTSALRDLDYNTKENNKEIERTNGRTLWIQQLRESLKD
jgi:hypothetical protein